MTVHLATLVASVALGVVGQVLLKTGAKPEFSVAAQLVNPATIVGLVIYVICAALYIFALRQIPVSVAFPSVAVSYALLAVAAHVFLGEPLGWQQLGAIALICGGTLLLHRS